MASPEHPAAKPLRVGTRVWTRKGRARQGAVTFVKRTHTRFVYMVRWNGNAHESGEYGLRDLGIVAADRTPSAACVHRWRAMGHFLLKCARCGRLKCDA